MNKTERVEHEAQRARCRSAMEQATLSLVASGKALIRAEDTLIACLEAEFDHTARANASGGHQHDLASPALLHRTMVDIGDRVETLIDLPLDLP